MEPHESTTHDENTINVEGTERLRSSSASSSSSSTSSSEFQDPIIDSFETGRKSSKGREKVEQGKREPDNAESALQSPPTQTMERPSTNDSGYRIPSSVFARNKSGTPKDWSTTSNESLFSIHTGNMSFTGDKYSWLMEVDEDLYNVPKPEESSSIDPPEAPIPEISSVQPPSNANDPNPSPTDSDTDHVTIYDPNEVSTTHHEKEEEKEEEKAKTSDVKKAKPSMREEQTTPPSPHSNDESGNSFAFPVLEGQPSVKSGLGSVPEKPEQQNKTESKEEQTTTAPEATNASGAWSSWFGSCMSCFSCRAKTEKDATASKD